MLNSATIRNHVNIVGQSSNTAPVLIMAHGFGSDQTAWRYLIEAFAPKYRIVLFDHVGSGKSDFNAYSPHRYKSLHSFTHDFLEICHELNLQQVTLIAHSVSCMVGLLAASLEPNRFKQLFFISASPCYLNDRDYIGGFEQADLDRIYAAMSSNYYAWASGFAPLVMGNADHPELAVEFAKSLLAMRPDISQAIARIIFQSDHRADLHKLATPTTIIQPKHDVAVPVAVGQYLAKHIPHSNLILTDTDGHLPHLSSPDIVISAIANYLQPLMLE
ncbi:MAG: alpha/beta hydrolase [Pseudanabaena frigida]|uniref:Alpha/beta hydrolase n=1 Tax=Pseudanabaena frigida TaxID=945775 RepID=A0A2W4WBL7_9CYAN|nr:MAG: alpha/beta hydrolase [Pseudanabaena frigida]